MDPIQIGLIETLNTMRSRNWRLGIMTQYPERVTKAVRSERGNYLIQCTPRNGDIVSAVVGRKDETPRWRRSPAGWYGYWPDWKNPLRWPKLEGNADAKLAAIWTDYLIVKADNQDERINENRQLFETRYHERRVRLLRARKADVLED